MMLDKIEAPGSVKNAAAAFIAFGVLGIINSLATAAAGGDTSRMFRGIIESSGFLFCAWGLLRLRSWGWWTAMLVVGIKLVAFIGALGAVLFLALSDPAATGSGIMKTVETLGLSLLWSLIGFVLLTIACVSLITPSSRAAFKVFRGNQS